MTRKFRALSAALGVALLAVAAAAPAQATPTFEAGAYPAKVQGQSANLVIGTEAGTVQCPTSFETSLSGPSAGLNLTPFIEYFNCSAWGFTGMTVNNLGCTERFEVTAKQAADEYLGHLDFCPSGESLTLSAGPCAIKIEKQENLAALDLDNNTVAPKRVAVTFGVSELAYTVTKDNFLCPFKGTGAKTGGTISAEPFALKAVNPSKPSEELGLFVSGE